MTDHDTLIPTGPPPAPPPPPHPFVSSQASHNGAAAWQSEPIGTLAAPAHRQRRRTSVGWDAVGIALTSIGVLLLLFFAYLFVFTPLTHDRDQHRLLQSLVGSPRSVFSLVAHHLPAEGRPVGILTIPALHQREVIVMGTSSADLQQGPGLMARTVAPGDPGNSVIAGRRATYGAPFGSLDRLVRGDRIEVVDGAGVFTFKVVSDRQISGGQADAVPVRGQAWLTLVTSSSPLVASSHVVVVAKATTTTDQTGPAPGARYRITLASLSGDPAAAVLALLWSLAFVAGLGVALYAIRRTRKVWLPYLFATPVLLACGLFACGSLARCLPATL